MCEHTLLITEVAAASKVYDHLPWSFFLSNRLAFFLSLSSFDVPSYDTIIAITEAFLDSKAKKEKTSRKKKKEVAYKTALTALYTGITRKNSNNDFRRSDL